MTEGTTTTATTPVEPAGRTRLRRWTLGLWVWVSVLFGLWALATPHWTPPDSIAHHLRAYGAAHGQVVLEDPGFVEGLPYATLGVNTVPAGLVDSATSVSCYTFQPEVSADCIAPIGPEESTVEYLNPLGQNPPLYYLATGWPSRFVDLADAVSANTAAALLLAALFVAWALVAARGMPRPALAVTAVVVGCTPTVLYFGGVLNPSSLEITTSMAMGACSMAFFSDPGSAWGRTMLRRSLVAATVMALTRMLAPVWILCWAAFLLLAHGRPGVRALFTTANVPWLALPFLGAAAQAAWTLLRVGQVVGAEPVADLSPVAAWRESMSQIDAVTLGQAVGVFGWGDTPLRPGLTNYYVVAGVFLVAACWLLLSRRASLALALFVATAYLLPIGLQALQWNSNGPVWQARYTMPLLVLVPIAALFLAARSDELTPHLWARLRLVFPVLLAVLAWVQVEAFLTLLRRNVDGLSGDAFSGDWSPPLAAPVLATLLGACVVATLVVLVAMYWRQPRSASTA